MKTAKLTPGPWAVQCQGRNETIYLIGPEPENTFIANLCSDLRWDDSFANANLIAAAPDLLKALEEVVAMEDWYKEEIPAGSPIGKAYRAIAKAKGKTHD